MTIIYHIIVNLVSGKELRVCVTESTYTYLLNRMLHETIYHSIEIQTVHKVTTATENRWWNKKVFILPIDIIYFIEAEVYETGATLGNSKVEEDE